MSYDIYLDTTDYTYTNVEPSTNYYTVELNANGGSSCSCEKASRESERSCEAEAEPVPGKCDCFSKSDKKATKKRKAAK